jgi:hypothetical protein
VNAVKIEIVMKASGKTYELIAYGGAGPASNEGNKKARDEAGTAGRASSKSITSMEFLCDTYRQGSNLKVRARNRPSIS